MLFEAKTTVRHWCTYCFFFFNRWSLTRSLKISYIPHSKIHFEVIESACLGRCQVEINAVHCSVKATDIGYCKSSGSGPWASSFRQYYGTNVLPLPHDASVVLSYNINLPHTLIRLTKETETYTKMTRKVQLLVCTFSTVHTSRPIRASMVAQVEHLQFRRLHT